MEPTPLEKINRTLENPNLSENNRLILVGIKRMTENNPDVFPTERQAAVVHGLFSRFGRTEEEQAARKAEKELQRSIRDLVGL